LDLPSDYTEPSSRAFVQVTEQVIQEAARSDSAVIVGRGSQFVLRNHPSALHVQIYASVDQRVDAVMAEQSIARAEAEHVVRDSDAARARYARHYYHADWLAPQHYHLLLNSGLFSRQGAVDIITKAVESLS
jgi:cytidylate kinase